MRFAFIILLCFIFWSSCSSHKDTINRIGDSYDKAMFNPNWETSLLSPEWYYRMTVVDTAPGSKALSVGDGHWLHPETIRFEITYDLLIGWRSQPTVPGSEAENSNYRGAPVVAFKITSHFDAARNYDPMTSAKGNLLVENTTDHGWDKRRFIKVDFSKNVVEELKRKDEGIVEMDNAFAVGKNDPSNPKRCRFEDGYFELTTRQGVQVDTYKYYGLNGEAFKMDASAPVIDLRFSFLRKPEKTNYQPLNYTDNLFDKFGFYRVAFTGQQQWDPLRGILESRKNYNITRFNIWNEDGSPKPIFYYTSVSHPKNLMNASRRVESEWNQIFKELVLEIKKDNYKNISEVPDMWVLKENSCNWKNVYQQLSDDLRKKVEESAQVTMSNIKSRLDHANDLSNANSFTQNTVEEAKALDDLEKICSALEFFTQGTQNAFKYQRSGDLRYNLLNLINKYALTDWSGLGPMFADKETGEIIQSQANVNLWYLDRRTQQVVDMINLMTGKIRFKELILGGDVQSYMNQKLTQIRQQELLLPETYALLKVQNRLEGQREDTVSEADISARLHLIDSSMIFSKIGDDDGVIDYVLEQQARIYKQSQNIADPPEFLDNLIVGMALQYKDTDPKIRFLKIRESVYTAVALHEVGHNTGLTHNMAGSADPVNYGAQFWKIQALPPDIFEAIKASRNDFEIQKALVACWNDSTRILRSEAKSQDCFRQQELMYSSIMDYQTSWNADLGGLGPYDKAAIFFGYGQLVQVFPEKNLLKTPKEKGLVRWLFLNDWRKIPTQLVDSHQKINERQWVSYDENNKLAHEVPYRFCIDSSGQQGPHCRAFDFGADMRGRAARNKEQYWNHYFLTHFSRDRIWNFRTDFQNIIAQDFAVFEDFNQIMRWYGYYMLTDPEFKTSDAAKDYLAAVVSGLNHYSHVLGHPLSGEHVTTVEDPNLLYPIDSIDACLVKNVQVRANVFLGDGRPFVVGLNNDYEDYHMNYVGSFHAKLMAGFFLSYPGSFFPRVDNLKDPRLFRMNWYRLFPEEVGDLFSKLILSEWSELGPLISAEGDLVHRDILDPQTLGAPDYLAFMPVLPANASMLPYRAMYYAAALLSSSQNTEFNLINSMQIGMEGAADDRKSAYATSENAITFESPNGHQYWAKKAGSTPIAYKYLTKLNDLKAKASNVSCMKMTHEGECCSPSNPDCPKILLLPCSPEELKLKQEQHKIDLENAVGFADDMRRLVQRYTTLR